MYYEDFGPIGSQNSSGIRDKLIFFHGKSGSEHLLPPLFNNLQITIIAYLLTLPLFAGVSRVRALSPAWTGSHALETLISRTHLFLPHNIPQQKNQVQ